MAMNLKQPINNIIQYKRNEKTLKSQVHVANYQVAFPIQPLKWMIKFQMTKHLSQKDSPLTWSFCWEKLVCASMGMVWSSQLPQHSSLPCLNH
jgi:hypothetical protein